MSTMRPAVYDALARLLEYPGEDTPAVCRGLVTALAAHGGVDDRATGLARTFADFAGGMPHHDLEEFYVRTFDLHAAVCLDVGYQLFGETYKRGAFLVTMKGAARRHYFLDGTAELPDHLSVALRLLGRLAPVENPDELVCDALVPALAKMRLGFGKERGGYALLLDLVDAVLRADFAEALLAAPTSESLPFRLPMLPDTSHFEGVNERD